MLGPGIIAGNPAVGRSDRVRVLFDLSHPAHVLQFVPIARELIARGHEVRLVGREKDVLRDLLEASGLPFEVPSAPPGPRGRLRDARELLMRVVALRRIVRHWSPAVVMTRNPSGVLAAVGTRAHSIFDTDDGRTVGLHYWLARPFADTTTSSVHDPESHGRDHRRYPGFKAQTYLHPERFRPDSDIRMRLGVPDGPLIVLRFSAHNASHDRRILGIDAPTRTTLVERCRAAGHLLIAREGQPTVLQTHADPDRTIPSEDFLDVLASADLCVGDSQSVAVEAALLGVPTIRLSGFTGRHFTVTALEEGYGLIRNFAPGEEAALLTEVERALRMLPGRVRAARTARDRLVTNTADPAAWFADLVERVG